MAETHISDIYRECFLAGMHGHDYPEKWAEYDYGRFAYNNGCEARSLKLHIRTNACDLLSEPVRMVTPEPDETATPAALQQMQNMISELARLGAENHDLRQKLAIAYQTIAHLESKEFDT